MVEEQGEKRPKFTINLDENPELKQLLDQQKGRKKLNKNAVQLPRTNAVFGQDQRGINPAPQRGLLPNEKQGQK